MPGAGQLATTDLVPPVISTPELEAGTRLGDRYLLIARLGRGGGGTVWRALDEKVGEELALKLLGGGADLERWRREVGLARRISHGNVCRVYDLGEARGLRWVTMEWIEGESLRALLQRGAIAEPDRLMRQLVDAVAAIHAAGVVHRDLKPENIVVDGTGRAVIVDFGLARRPVTAEPAGTADRAAALDHRTVTDHGAIVGTPRYMAPEQAAGESVDARSDVYALGLVLDEIARGGSGATGEMTGAAEAATIAAGSSVPSARAPRTGAALPRPWGPVIARCTARAAADRFADAVAVRAALDAPRRKQRSLAIGGVAIAVALAAVALSVRAAEDPAPRAKPLAQRRLTATASAPASQPSSIALSPDGRTLAYTAGRGLVVRPIDGGRDAPVAMPITPGGLPLARLVEASGFLDDGRVVAQILDRDHHWALWALGTGQPPQLLYRHDERMIVAVSPRTGQLAVAVPGAGLIAVAVGGGPDRPLVAARPGERLGGLAWSPDGARVAFVRHATDGGLATVEAVAVARPAAIQILDRVRIADPIDPMTAWPAEDRVIYVVNDADGAALVGVPLGATPAPPEALVRWPDEYVAGLAWGGGRMVVLRGTAERTIEVGTVDRRGYFLNLERAVPEHARTGQLAGWTTDGRLVHAADADVVLRPPFGPAIVLASGSPDAVVGDAVVYHRAAALRTSSVAGDGERALIELPPGRPEGDLVRCAGDRAPPCVFAEADRKGVRYVRFDPATGARRDELHRAPLGARFTHAMAVSPDGATLAVIDGSSAVTLVPLGGGAVRRESLARSAEIVGVSWSRDGASLLVSVLAGGDDRASVFRLWPGGARQLLLHSDRLRYGRVHEAPDGERIAIQTRELALDAWLIEGL